MKKMIDTCEAMKTAGADYLLLNSPAFYKMQMTYNSILEYYTRVGVLTLAVVRMCHFKDLFSKKLILRLKFNSIKESFTGKLMKIF